MKSHENNTDNTGLPIAKKRTRSKKGIENARQGQLVTLQSRYMKLDIQTLYQSYLRTGSVHKAALEFNTSGETVRQHLLAGGKKLKRSKWTSEEVEFLKQEYSNPDGFDVDEIAKSLGKTHAAVACKADNLGICGARGKQIRTPRCVIRMCSAQKKVTLRPGVIEKRAKAVSDAIKKNGHPRGMLGKPQSQKAKDAVSKAHVGKKISRSQVNKGLATKFARYGSLAPKVTRGNWKAAWHEIEGIRFFARSKWESNYAYYLQWRKDIGEILKWEHEPETFWFKGIKRGVVSYLPDFRVTMKDGSIEYHEVKGWMDSKSKTKIKRMAKYHPLIKLDVIDSKRYNALNRQVKGMVNGWV